ncbi:MAG TPA: hypothetical protein VN030_03265 [Cellvibrio sp.]|nr:hypothetical protein [Cellvibrio sp.]
MNNYAEDTTSLEKDADFAQPLRRVAYEAGMLLGLEATRDEQSYHRRRLSRHQYWLEGYGTLAGMVVAIDPKTAVDNTPIATRLTVSPGIGIDGLGREIFIHESYGIDLSDWLKVQNITQLEEGYDDANNLLWLTVTVRYQEVPVGLQPVLARKLNLSTDAVEPSRMADSILLELIPELPPAAETRYAPWAAHDPLADATPTALTSAENTYLGQVSSGNATAGAQLQLHARLLHALGDSGLNSQLAADRLEEGSRIVLARLSIQIADLNSILTATENQQLVNPNLISVNNLVRPFLHTASQLAYLLTKA